MVMIYSDDNEADTYLYIFSPLNPAMSNKPPGCDLIKNMMFMCLMIMTIMMLLMIMMVMTIMIVMTIMMLVLMLKYIWNTGPGAVSL